MKKILIIRFSSFGDIVQAMSVIDSFSKVTPDAQITWLTKYEFSPLVGIHPGIKNIWGFKNDKKNLIIGLASLWVLAKKIHSHQFDLIYDAHNTLRTLFLRVFLKIMGLKKESWICRPKSRWKRFLFFKLKIKSALPAGFQGMHSYHWPLEKWGINFSSPPTIQWCFAQEITDMLMREYIHKLIPGQHFVTLAPSAAWPMKRWPLSHWKKIIELLPEFQFIVLGGPDDDFCQELYNTAPLRVINAAGKLTLLESCALVFLSQVVVAADTGILHVADLFGVDAIGLIGPTAFGFPSNPRTIVMEVDLKCRPCTKDGRGRCSQKIYQQCMVDINPQNVATEIRKICDS